MGYNNKYILEGNNESKKLIGELLSCVDDEIMGDIRKIQLVLTNKININLIWKTKEKVQDI